MSEGWAIKLRKSTTKFTTKQKEYLTNIFDNGIKSNKKLDERVVEKMMQNERKNEVFLFKPAEFLSASQIKSFFSRLAATREKMGTSSVVEINEDPDEELPVDDNDNPADVLFNDIKTQCLT